MTEWTWLGDHPAVDLANTIRIVDGQRVELIGTVDAFAEWADLEPAALPPARPRTEAELTRVHRLRDSAVRLLDAAVTGRELPAADVRAVNDAVRASATTRLIGGRVGATETEARDGTGLDGLLGVLAATVVDLLGRDHLANLAVCHADGCGQFFHRARPNQRWCSPGCGNRARVDRHRHRRRATPTP
ncbi:CGNR zinc finger domain-containing protein [Enemella evansiae]|uniref:CGNR zinc finger domain-containing protein n=1 Tax=Enemella evansiae TaxID=2016499 RepID=UPI0010E526F0|nr:ABATE domain-containing protein [Enemella evansiae]TDO91688.1 putative RNA-binding Zn ribbon-like protein [Enemella evansiae]